MLDEETGKLTLAEEFQAAYDDDGKGTYSLIVNGETEEIKEADYEDAFERYAAATVLHFY